MATGAGKYDDALTTALKECKAERGVLIIFDGKEKGAGFSLQCCQESMKGLPYVLENIAAQIRKDLPTKS